MLISFQERFITRRFVFFIQIGDFLSDLEKLIELSKTWEKENITNGYIANTEKDILEPLVVAIEKKKIIGYCFGEFYTEKSTFSYIKPGSKCFRISEIYVLPKYRDKGVGETLIKMIQDEVKNKCEYTVLSTSTKDYQKILRFYCEKADMDFHSAFLIKKN